MFKLLRYFSAASFVAIALVILALVGLYRQTEISQLVKLTETENVHLTRTMANALWPRFGDYVVGVRETDNAALNARRETGNIRDALARLTRGVPVLKVKIFNAEGVTVFSSEADQIGEVIADNPGFLSAMANVSASQLTQHDTISTFSGEAFGRDVVETYVGVEGADGDVEAVFELYTDVSGALVLIDAAVARLTGGLLVAFGLLYAALFLIVRRADRILHAQYAEIEANARATQAHNEELARLREKALDASRAKSELMANMSHELRTPLNAIIGFADAIRSEILGPLGNEKYADYIHDIHDSGEHLLALINDILDVAAIEEGAMTLHEHDVAIDDVTHACLRLLEPVLDKNDVALDVRHLAPATLRADPRRVRQALLNVLGNAAKFTPAGGRIIVEGRVMNGDYVLSIADTGIGMTADELDVALSKFGQVDSGLARRHDGTGLGLPLTRGLMEMHDGALDVTSEKGRGTTVTLTFPAARVTPADDA